MTDDRTAVSMVLGGNTDAYALLVEKYQTPLYRTALAILHDPHTAEDVLQDAFITGYLRLNTLRSPDKFCPWMAQIVKKRCFNVLSRTRTPESGETLAEYLEALPDDTPTPEELLVTGESTAAAEKAIAALPPHLSETARLFFLHGIRQKQIAAHLGIPEGTVKRRIHDAKQRLKKELDAMNQTNEKPRDGFTARVTEKIAELENYNKIHGSGVGFDAAYRDTLSLIGELADREEAGELAAKATKAAYNTDAEKYTEEAIESAVRNNDPLLLADAYTTKWNRIHGDAEALRYLEETVIPAVEAFPVSDVKFAALGRVKFWAHYHALRENETGKSASHLAAAKELLAGYAHLVSNENQYYTAKEYYLCMYACALAGEAAMKRLAGLPYREDMYHMGVTSQAWKKENGNRKLVYQPGYTTGSGENTNLYRYAEEIYYYAACSGDGWFFPHTDCTGENEIVHKEYNSSPVVQSIVSRTESVMTPAGVFENCLHIRKTDSDSTYDIWYAENVGIVRFDETEAIGSVSGYLLSEYDHRGGEGWLPTAEGNRWKYVNISTAEGVEGMCEYCMIRDDEDYVYLTAVCEAGILTDAPEDTPEVMMLAAEKFVSDGNCDRSSCFDFRRISFFL